MLYADWAFNGEKKIINDFLHFTLVCGDNNAQIEFFDRLNILCNECSFIKYDMSWIGIRVSYIQWDLSQEVL